MNKLNALLELEKKNLNVHNYKVFDKPEQLCSFDISKSYTVRFDKEEGDVRDLPFVILDAGKYDINDVYSTIVCAVNTGCRVIISDGRNYDKIMLNNIVYKIDSKGNFLIEWSDLKIPLRHMYRHPLFWVSGNITEPKHWWNRGGRSNGGIDLCFIKRFMLQEYPKGLFDRFVECTTYASNVGKLNKNIVYWQI